LAWLNNQWSSDCPALYRLRSVGQHYGMDTGLLDASASTPVALWFATHDFGSGKHRADDSAVVYRIDRTACAMWRSGCGPFRTTRESSTWRRLTSATRRRRLHRASRQHGWSLVGWDHPRLLIRMAAEGFLRRYVWSTGETPFAINHLTREDLVPPVDPTGVRRLRARVVARRAVRIPLRVLRRTGPRRQHHLFGVLGTLTRIRHPILVRVLGVNESGRA
jgi:hypothetical protein